jgi:3-hydroxyisobutyrate dehydrogenase
LIEKDFNYVLREASGPEAAPTNAAARGVFRRAIERGLGGDNMTGAAPLVAR